MSDAHTQCESLLKLQLEKNPLVKFLMDALKRTGGSIEGKIICAPCTESIGGGFHPINGITICENKIIDKNHLSNTLAHELIHAYDDCNYKMQWTNPQHLACSEIRAAMLSGDCSWGNELRRGNIGFIKKFQTCIKRRAILSMKATNDCKCDNPEEVVEAVFSACFANTDPFIDIP